MLSVVKYLVDRTDPIMDIREQKVENGVKIISLSIYFSDI
jgi:hypothetical protein